MNGEQQMISKDVVAYFTATFGHSSRQTDENREKPHPE
jgi:hypothetical protein